MPQTINPRPDPPSQRIWVFLCSLGMGMSPLANHTSMSMHCAKHKLSPMYHLMIKYIM